MRSFFLLLSISARVIVRRDTQWSANQNHINHNTDDAEKYWTSKLFISLINEPKFNGTHCSASNSVIRYYLRFGSLRASVAVFAPLRPHSNKTETSVRKRNAMLRRLATRTSTRPTIIADFQRHGATFDSALASVQLLLINIGHDSFSRFCWPIVCLANRAEQRAGEKARARAHTQSISQSLSHLLTCS